MSAGTAAPMAKLALLTLSLTPMYSSAAVLSSTRATSVFLDCDGEATDEEARRTRLQASSADAGVLILTEQRFYLPAD